MNQTEIEKIARAYGLKNAIAYEGNASQGAIIAGLFAAGLEKSDLPKNMKLISQILKEINSKDIEEQKDEFEKYKKFIGHRQERDGLPELPEVDKKKGVITRFSPSPSGAMHIGHALTSSISYLFVKEYGGKMYLRIEDTNPENIFEPAYKLLEQDAAWLFENNFETVIQSERMELYYKYVDKFLKKDAVYVCTCQSEKFKELIDKMQTCPCRSLSSKENMSRWKKMLDPVSKKGYDEGEAVLRFKSDIKNKNPALRDFPLARINLSEHPLQKHKYKVWPLMNLAVTVDDIEMSVTHVIRAKEHRDNATRQKMMYVALGVEKKYPWTSYLGRINLKDMELSATQITKGVNEGKYSGWDDPALPTLAALRKKGYKPQAFHKFAERIGLSENDKTMDKKEFFQLLDSFNRD
ncbi:hypothetical protein COU57_00820 [Candidatus Pacearchaeota archaeon CG10_big_fil_rev_8_21_14_0_10_32_14]|nr:MAG: hypothetical protein COU57_00820 [Candidatus Pacearchaeota archaeon CG10_big_fil_rev_8_21_14_0_10_32_14]